MLGESATFEVAAVSTTTLSYQWMRDGVAVPGATSASLVIPSVSASDSGASFTVSVTSSGVTVASSAATLTAHADPQGIYYGTIGNGSAVSPQPFYAIVTHDGTTALFAKTGDFTPEVPLGRVFASNAALPTVYTLTKPYTAYVQLGSVFPDGNTTMPGQLSFDVTPGTSITGTYTSQIESGSFNLSYVASDYERAASATTIAGTYHYKGKLDSQVVNGTLVFAADGTFTGTDTAGCTISGTYSIPDPARNAYKVVSDETCPWGTVKFTGLQAFYPAGTTADIYGTTPFATDTLVLVVSSGESGNLLFASK